MWLERTDRVIAQTSQVLAGNVHIKDRLVSLFDPDARPIRRGKLKAPTEFGFKVTVADEDRGFVTDYQVTVGNPEDSTLLVGSVERHIDAVGKVPREVAVDRGMASAPNDVKLEKLGGEHRCLPKTGKKRRMSRPRKTVPGSVGYVASAPAVRRASVCSSASTAGATAGYAACRACRAGWAGVPSPTT